MITDKSGQYSAIWRPYHYIGLELAQSIYSIALDNKSTGQTKYFNADVISLAKKDLNIGDILDGEGGFTARGRLITAKQSIDNNYLPLGITDGAKIKRKIRKDEYIKLEDVEINWKKECFNCKGIPKIINIMKKYIILIPVYNDWKSVFKLLENIDEQIKDWDVKVSVLIINDASTEERTVTEFDYKNLQVIKIINMKENRGHARSYASGLKYISEKENVDYIILMDGDGEDRPEELNLLFNKSKENPDKVVTANRVKRSEGNLFKFCYLVHKYFTFIFTGQLIKFGNYTCLPKSVVSHMLENASTWSSFSGSLN